MKKLSLRLLLTALIINTALFSLYASANMGSLTPGGVTVAPPAPTLAPSTVQEKMKWELRYIAQIFEDNYAPAPWKKQHLGWNLQTELLTASNAIDQKSDISIEEYHKILAKFFQSTQDYHVSYEFNQTEKATLAFTIHSAEGRYFIVHVDRDKLPKSVFPFSVGDEVIKMDGQPVQDVVNQLIDQKGMGTPQTDQALGELYLTNRAASRGVDVPKTHAIFTFKKKGSDKETSYQLAWDYHKEDIDYSILFSPQTPTLLFHSASATKPVSRPSFLSQIENLQMVSSAAEDSTKYLAKENPYRIGAKKSYIPELGSKIWEIGSNDDELFHAYIYKNEAGKLIGYLRIPSYSGGKKNIDQLIPILTKMEKLTEGLVIDQIDNPGGSIFYLYTIASLFASDYMHTPLHHMTLTPGSVMEAYKNLKELENIDTDEKAKKVLGEDFGGYPVSLQTVYFFRSYAQFILSEWSKGHRWTDPYYIAGVDKINPSQEVTYTKPILFLTNALDFSGGDFLPAILQDNKRITVLGTRTAGAGGYIVQVDTSNSTLGLAGFVYTGSIAERVNKQPIENLGVTPDIPYELTVDDLQGNYKGYVKKINEEISNLIK